MSPSLLVVPAITGPIFMIIGFILLNFPPKKINGLYGYRTLRSMKSQEAWDFSQTYSAKEMIKLGGILTISPAISFLFNLNFLSENIIGVSLFLIGIIVLFIRVEKAIKKKFPEN